MKSADDVELASGHPGGASGLMEDLLERSRVCTLLLWHSRERAEGASVPEDADVRRVDVLICGKEDPVSVAEPVGVLCECAESQKIRGGVKDQCVIGGEPLSAAHLFGERAGQRITQSSQVDPAGHRISLDYRD